MNTLNFINISRTVCVRAVREESIKTSVLSVSVLCFSLLMLCF